MRRTGSAAKRPIQDPAQPRALSPNTIRVGVLLILCAGFLVYAAPLGFGFAYDDFPQIVDNARIQSAEFLPAYFTHHVWAQTQGQTENLYRPVYLCWLLLNFGAFGSSPSGWHVLNLLMHLLMTSLVYVLGRKLLPEQPLAALVAAAVFALHPVHVEAVAWVSGGTECLLGVLFTGSFLCYLTYRRSNGGGWLAASLLFFAAAMLTKETAVVLPGILVCYELLRIGPAKTGSATNQTKIRSVAGVVGAYVALGGLYFIVRAQVLHGVAHRISDVPLSTVVLTWPWVIYFYLSQLLFPAALGPFYNIDYANGASLQLLYTPIFVIGAMTLAVWWWCKKSRTAMPLFLSAWLLFTLLPALGVFTIMLRYEGVHDRYLYLPSVGFALLAGYAASTLFEHSRMPRKGPVLGTVAAGLLVLAGIATYRQSLYWENNLTLFRRGVALAPRNVLARLNLTSELIRNQMLDGAFEISQQALALDPDSARTLAAAGQAAYLVQKYTMAEEYYSRALALAPPRVDELYYLGMAHIKTGRYSEALAVLQKGNSLWPNSPGYHLAMGKALAGLGQWSAAREEYKLELALNPGSAPARAALEEAGSR